MGDVPFRLITVQAAVQTAIGVAGAIAGAVAVAIRDLGRDLLDAAPDDIAVKRYRSGRPGLGQLAHPFGTGLRLAKATSSHQKPDTPRAGWWQLRRPRP